MIAGFLIALTAFCLAWPDAPLADDSPDTAMTRVEHDYLLSCAGCHRFDGAGSGGVPSLHDTSEVLSMPGGREYLASVPGVAQAPLGDERLAELLNWVLAEFGGAEGFQKYSATEVGRLRAQPLRAPRAARAALMARVGQED